jgi:hypothetical protein
MTRRHKLAIVATVGVLAAAAGGAYAATQTGGSSGSTRQALLDDVAHRLHVTPAQLENALRGALIDRLNAAVKAGRLTRTQANAIERRIERGRLPLWLGPRRLFGGPPPRGRRAALQAAAGYLGLAPTQLLKDLRSGQSLAQIARARGKPVTGLEQAMLAALRLRLDRAVAAGLITRAQERRILSRSLARLRIAVERPLRPRWPTRPGGRLAPPGPAAGV